MKKSFQQVIHRVRASLRTPRGRDILTFVIFVSISAILWSVLSLNEEEQYDLRMPLKITHVPDSATIINPGPEALSVSVRGRGTQMFKFALGSNPSLNIDFRAYRSGNYLHLSNSELKALIRQSTGATSVSAIYPDSISIPYTTNPGVAMPVVADYKVTAASQASLNGRPKLSTDTAKVYVVPGQRIPDNFESVVTEPIRLSKLDKTTTRRVRLIGPSGARILPDSVDITFDVEPLIMKNRKIVIEPINVPADIKLITFPAQIDVYYMVPMSAYTTSDPHFRVVADYRRINLLGGSKKVKLRLSDVPDNLQNVRLSADSAEYIIERL